MKRIIIWLIVVVVIIVGAVWLLNRNSSSPAATSTATQSAVVLNTASNSMLGTFLIASNGMTLYQFNKDTAGVSNCSGQCAVAWPPYTVSSTPLTGGTGVTGSISTLTRADGTTQLEYNGLPLYFWQGDTKQGEATGQNVNGFSVVQP